VKIDATIEESVVLKTRTAAYSSGFLEMESYTVPSIEPIFVEGFC
jgi:hypothetical protein